MIFFRASCFHAGRAWLHHHLGGRHEEARGYLIQLCKHFAHKIEAAFAGNKGRIAFGASVCELNAEDETVLIAQVSTADETQLATLEDVIERHLKRFAFKEDLSVQWIRG